MPDPRIAGDVIDTDNGFQTCDLYLAAFFTSAGCKMVTANRESKSRRVYFVFEKNPILLQLQLDYFSREAKIPALTYADNIKSLKSLCHNIINGSN